MATLFGIDVSHHNGEIRWHRVARGPIVLAYAKATEGAAFVDPMFDENWPEIREAGLLRGAYHFFRPSAPVREQAENFIAVVRELTPGDLPPVLDLEETRGDEWKNVLREERLPAVMEWLERVEQALGRTPIIYTRGNHIEATYGQAGPLADYGLWVAHYTAAARPNIPSAWNTWLFWQYTQSAEFHGVKGKLDKSRFSGSRDDLLSLAGLGPGVSSGTPFKIASIPARGRQRVRSRQRGHSRRGC